MNLTRLARNQWDRFAAVAVLLVGLVALYLGWRGVSDHTLATEQIPYIVSGAILGLFLLGVAATLWLSADLRDAWQALRQVHDDFAAEDDNQTAHIASMSEEGALAEPTVQVIADRPVAERPPRPVVGRPRPVRTQAR